MIDGRIRNRLMEHLKELHGNHQKLYFGDMAAAIMADPQEHIDALVEAGILRHDHGLDHHLYRIPKPHVHEWRAERLARSLPGGPYDVLVFECGCGDDLSLSIEMPS